MTAPSEPPAADEASSHPPGSLSAGRVGRPHGLDGSFYVTRPRPRLLTLGTEVTLAGRTAAIVRRAGTDARPIIRLEGIDARTQAEELRGMDLSTSGGDAPALGEGEWWAHELEGCEVLDGRQLLGTVNRLVELPSCEALEVLPARGGEPVLVPLVRDAVREVAPAQRRIEVNLDFLGLTGVDSTAGGGGDGEST
ncbi:MAG TPA: ribosome maturation factor RimM [Solirubrobacteraceae bacterium]